MIQTRTAGADVLEESDRGAEILERNMSNGDPTRQHLCLATERRRFPALC